MWPFKRKVTPTEVLVEQIIQEGIERRKVDAEIASRHHSLEMRKLELEMEHIEALGDERRKERADREQTRRARQQAAALAREAAARKRMAAPTDEGACKVCINPSDPGLTARDIEWHANGHREGPSIWQN